MASTRARVWPVRFGAILGLMAAVFATAPALAHARRAVEAALVAADAVTTAVRAPAHAAHARGDATVVAPAIAVHQRLIASSPADGEELEAPPAEIRLEFAEAVNAELTRLELRNADGDVVFDTPFVLASPNAVVQPLPPLAAGAYTLTWRTAGADGHPVTGSVSFVVLTGAEPTPDASGETQESGGEEGVSGADATMPPPAPAESTHGSTFDASSPLYVLIRWFTLAGTIGVLGAVAFRFVVLRLLASGRAGIDPEISTEAGRNAAILGGAAAALLLGAAAARFGAQTVALAGGSTAELVPVARALTRTVWGWGWMLQMGAALAGILGFGIAARRPFGWSIAGAGAVAAAIAPALSGHAAAAVPTALAIGADACHVTAAGGWIGGLTLLLAAGGPAAVKQPPGRRAAAAAALVRAFSPVAIACAAVAATTGLVCAWIHIGGVDALLASQYGRTLLLKIALLGLVGAIGAYHFLRVRNHLAADVDIQRFRASATLELLGAAAVLLVTAILIATPPPTESSGRAAAPGAADTRLAPSATEAPVGIVTTDITSAPDRD